MFDPKALRLFLDTLSDAVLVIDRGARVYHANAVAHRWWGAAPGLTLQGLQDQLGDELVQALLPVLSKGVPRRHAAPPAIPPVVTLGDGSPASVTVTPLEGERWAVRLVRSLSSGAAPSVASTTSVAAAASTVSPAAIELLRMVRGTAFPACLLDAQFRLLEVNAAYAEFAGRSAAELVGLDPVELQPAEDHELNYANRAQWAAEGTPQGRLMERRLVHADGRERWYRANVHRWPDDGSAVRYFTLLQDSTAEHVARERADRSARELDDWFDLSPVGMVLFDEQGLLVRTNPAFEALVGRVPVVLSDADDGVQQLLCWHDGRPHEALQPDANPVESQAFVDVAGRGPRRVRAVLRSYRTAFGHLRYMAVVEDRSAEEERDLAQMQIGALMDTAGVGIATLQESGGWVQHAHTPGAGGEVSAAAAALQSIRREVVMPDSMPEYERLQHALRHGERTEVRYAIRHPELGQRWLQTRVEPATLASGQRTTSVVTLDVTEQQQAQLRSDTLLREMTTILESTTAGIAYLRAGVLVRCNSRFESLLGFHSGKVVGAGLAALFRAQPQPLQQQLVADIEASLAADTVFETELQLGAPRNPQPDERPTLWCALTVRRAGEAGEAIAVLSDITRLKTQQMELEALARDREIMFSLSDVGIAFLRQDRIERANEAMCRISGYGAHELRGLDNTALYAAEPEHLRVFGVAHAALRDTGRWAGERQLRRRDGSLIWVQVSARLVNEHDPDQGVIASYVNVDDRHRAQQAVALQAERTRAILDSVLVGIVTVGPMGIEWMNRSARRMFGGDLTDFIGQPMSTVATPGDDHPFLQTHYAQELVEGQAETFECQVRGRDGRVFWIVGNVVATGREATGRQLTFALLDIERRRQAEARIAEAQASLQRVIEAAPLAIALFEAPSLRILQVNKTAANVIGRATDELVGRSVEELFSAEEAAVYRHDMTQALASQDVTKREYGGGMPGNPRNWDARYLPLAGAHSAVPDQLLLVATDVTEQRAAQEARLEAAIAQREMLVKEVHHRIKNNLQGVAGLLQQIGARKPEMRPAIAEVVGQVQAIAQVYGLQVGATGPLRVKSVLEAITGSVQRTFGRVLTLSVDGPAHLWALPEAESIPIALTLNELLTNAVKHSQSAGEAPEVHCRLHCDDDGVCIEVANPGQLPAGFSLARFPGGVSGLGLVRALLPRRNATLTLEQHGDEVVARVSLVPPGVTRLAPV